MHPKRKELTAYLDGSLAAGPAQVVESHLQSCAECDATIGTMNALSDTVAEKLRGPAPVAAHEAEPACESMVEAIKQLGQRAEPSSPGLGGSTGLAGPASAEAPPLGNLREYKLLKKLGEGGMGAVYRALHTKLDKTVALKVLRPALTANATALSRFEREMRAVGKLKHPNIVAAHDAGEAGGTHYLVMELVEGEDLAAVLRRHGPLDVADACELVRQAALGLQEAFEHGMVHRDIKPSNLMLAVERRRGEATGVVKILDMGLALLDSSHAGDGDLTGAGQLMGTVNYMAPEQATDTHRVDIRADIFALGAVLYELLTGRIPLEARRHDTTINKLLALVREPIPKCADMRQDLPPELAALIDRMLAKDPDDRPATPEEVSEALEPFCAGQNIAALVQTTEAGRSASAAPSTARGQSSQRTASSSARVSSAAARKPTTASRAAAPTASHGGWRRSLPVIALGLAGGAAAIIAAVLFFVTSEGTLRIEVNDPTVEVGIVGSNIVLKHADTQDVALSVGQHQLLVKRSDFSFQTSQIELRKGATVTVKIELLPGKVQVVSDGRLLDERAIASVSAEPLTIPSSDLWKPTPEQEAFIKAVAAIPTPKAQLDAVARKLVEVNVVPEHDVVPQFEPKDGPPARCKLKEAYVRIIWPLAALPTLKRVDLTGTGVIDFAPLTRLRLTDLQADVVLDNLASEQVVRAIGGLETINSEPAAAFYARRAKIRREIDDMTTACVALSDTDQAQWLEAKLRELNPRFTGKVNASAGAGKESVAFWTTAAGERNVHFRFVNGMFDLSPLRGLALNGLVCSGIALHDLTPVTKLKLRRLELTRLPVSDLSPLADLPLERLLMYQTPSATGLAPFAKMKLKSVTLFGCAISDLSPLRGMPLELLEITGMPANDLPLIVVGKPLKTLAFDSLEPDISFLKGMPLENLSLAVRLYFPPDEALLKSLPLRVLNNQPPATFWEQVAKRRQADEAVVAAIAKLPPDKTEAALRAELRKHGNDPQVKLVRLADGDVVEITLDKISGDRDILTPLRAFPKLRKLTFTWDKYQGIDLSPLLTLPLEEINCGQLVEYNAPVLRAMPGLKLIDGRPARDVLDDSKTSR